MDMSTIGFKHYSLQCIPVYEADFYISGLPIHSRKERDIIKTAQIRKRCSHSITVPPPPGVT